MKYPKVSIVVPTYNRSVYLQECLDSIINQNYTNLEIVITDDNSTDNTEELCKKYIKKYPYIKYVKNEKYPQGPNGNKNNGLDNCTGEIVGIFDDDDSMVENILQIMVDKILEGYDDVMGNCIIVSKNSNNGKFSGEGMETDGEVHWRDILCGKIKGEYWSIFKKEILGNNRFDTDLYGGESILWQKILKDKKIYYFHKAVRNYKINDDGVMNNTINRSNKVIKNYEKDIEYNGDEMKKYCPCHLATIYKGASYFAKLSNQYNRAFKYTFKSIILCPKYISAYSMLFINLLPNNIIKYLAKLKSHIKYKAL